MVFQSVGTGLTHLNGSKPLCDASGAGAKPGPTDRGGHRAAKPEPDELAIARGYKAFLSNAKLWRANLD